MVELMSQKAQILIKLVAFALRMTLRVEPKVLDGFHYMTQKFKSFNNIVIVTIGYKTHFWLMTKSKAIDRMKNVDLGKICEKL